MSRARIEIVRNVVPLAIVLAGFLLLAVVGRSQPPESKTSTKDNHVAVETAAITPHEGGLRIEVDGLATPFREIVRSAEVAGRVLKKSPKCEAGTFVAAGEVLIEIDPQEYALEIERLAGELAQAQFNLEEVNDEVESAQELIKLAQRDAELRDSHFKRLVEARRTSAVSEQAVDDAERNWIAARNTLVNLDRQLDSARIRASGLEQAIKISSARKKQAQLNLDRTTIKAPVSGVITTENVEQDAYVRVGDPLFSIEDTSAIEVRCNLRMEELRWVWNQDESKLADDKLPEDAQPGMQNEYRLPPTEVDIRFELGGRVYLWNGVLTRYDGLGLDERTRTVPCRILVANPREVRLEDSSDPPVGGPRALVRGMFVTAIIKTQPKAHLLRVPEVAVQPGNIVWRAKDVVEDSGDDRTVREGVLDRVKINVVQTIGDWVVIDADEAGLSAGDRVVTSPLSTAYEGMEVRETEAEDSSPAEAP